MSDPGILDSTIFLLFNNVFCNHEVGVMGGASEEVPMTVGENCDLMVGGVVN